MASQISPVIVWFRRDLRLQDNPALAEAVNRGAPVVPVYILDEALDGRVMGAASRWWLNRSLRSLDASLRALGSRLILRSGPCAETLGALVGETGADAVMFNRLYEPGLVGRDDGIARALKVRGVETLAFNAALLAEPGAIRNGQGEAYRVFTPFSRALWPVLEHPWLQAAPDRIPVPDAWPVSENLDRWGLHPSAPDWSAGFEVWEPGEDQALSRLEDFTSQQLADYPAARDVPGLEGTSRLSPHLHFGEISPWRVVASAQAAALAGDAGAAAADKLVTEVAWREFNAHLMAAFPALPTQSFRPEFEAFPWRRDPEAFRAWTRGRTGYPLVDAGMRQLWVTGWMHNRVRMVVASFLVKHLLIDWREGEAWFWDTLVDADLASNVGNWQWTAGSGADAAPYFRIFNPVIQGERFDPEGRYVRTWLPELAALPDRWIHAPWTAPELERRAAGLNLGVDYHFPIVDHAQARGRALAALASLKSGSDLYAEPLS